MIKVKVELVLNFKYKDSLYPNRINKLSHYDLIELLSIFAGKHGYKIIFHSISKFYSCSKF